VIDRLNRETWEEGGSMELYERACAEVETRLAKYEPFETDPAIDTAMRDLVKEGLVNQTELPELPPAEKPAPEVVAGRRGRAGRRRR